MDTNNIKNKFGEYRQAPFWSWNDRLDRHELERQIREMAAKGWGGYFMHSRVGLETEYLSPEWMELICACAVQARLTDTKAWLYDEDKWPSGFAGGRVPLESEEYRSRALVLLKKEELTSYDTVLQDVNEGSYGYHICKRIASLGNNWFNGACYTDLMNPDAVEAFLKSTHEQYKNYCGEFFGREIPGMFTDEPNYLMERHYKVPALPWSESLPDFFKKLKGYRIEDYLASLFFDKGDYKKTRFDFFDAATRLFVCSYTKQCYTWCEKNNLKLVGHMLREDNLIYQLQCIGAAMPHYEFMHWPGVDKLGRNLNELVAMKQVSSVADQLGKDRIMCESFGGAGQQVSFFHRKWMGDWQAVLGINFIVPHLALYSMRGERKRDFPPNLNYQQPWWEDEKGFSDYAARLSQVLSVGKRKVDILVLHPIASVWSEYSPLHKRYDFCFEKERYDKVFENISRMLIANKLDFHYGDEIIMSRHARMENGKLHIGRHSYSTVVMPPLLTLMSGTYGLLKEFVKSDKNNRLIFIGDLPERIDGSEADIEWPDGVITLNGIDEALQMLDNIYRDRISILDESTGANATKIICHERYDDEGHWLFIANTDEKRETNALVSINENSKPVALDLMSGDTFEVSCELSEGRVRLKAKFHPAGSILLLFSGKEIGAEPGKKYLNSGVEWDWSGSKTRLPEWEADVLEPNVLPLDFFTLHIEGNMAADGQHVAKARDLFCSVPDGAGFKAEYRFSVLNVPEGELFAVIEKAENLDSITVNGFNAKPLKNACEGGSYDPDVNWKDAAFTKVPVTGLIARGENILTIEGKKFNSLSKESNVVKFDSAAMEGNKSDCMSSGDTANKPTELETVYLIGNFTVSGSRMHELLLDAGKFRVDPNDLTVSGYPFYAGSVEFKTCISVKPQKGKVYFSVDDVKAASIKLYVNNRYVDIKYLAPYLFDITGLLADGYNEIKLAAATTLFNLLGPTYISGSMSDEFTGPGTFSDFSRHTEKFTLAPFGIGRGCLTFSK